MPRAVLAAVTAFVINAVLVVASDQLMGRYSIALPISGVTDAWMGFPLYRRRTSD